MRGYKYEIDKDDYCLPFVYDLHPIENTLLWIDTKLAFQEKLNIFLTKEITIIGIDTETKPYEIQSKRKYNSSIGMKRNILQHHPTSIIQIAIRTKCGLERVCIFDLLALYHNTQVNDSDCNDEISNFLESLFTNPSVLKVGQGLDHDFKELCMSYPNVKCFQNVYSILETNKLHKYFDPNITHLKSLKSLVKIYLHSNLIKTQQVSDWSYRPLSSDQLYYAACDALVLLRLYDAIICEMEEYNYINQLPLNCNESIKEMLTNFNYNLIEQLSDNESILDTPISLVNVHIPILNVVHSSNDNEDLSLHDITGIGKFHNPLERKYKSSKLEILPKPEHIFFPETETKKEEVICINNNQSKVIQKFHEKIVESTEIMKVINKKENIVWQPLHEKYNNSIQKKLIIGKSAMKLYK